MGHSEDGFQGFYLLPGLSATIVLQGFLNWQDHISLLLDHFLHCPCEYFDSYSFTVSTMGEIAFLVFLIFSLFVKSNT